MRKIRGFKLKLRVKEIQRRAKKAHVDLATQGLGAEPELQEWIERISAKAAPAVLYDSFPAGDAAGLTAMPGLAFSLAIATLGPDLDAYAAELPPELLPAFEVAAAAALEEAGRFVLSLVEDEAQQERCALSPIHYLAEREHLEAALAKLEGHKIGVALGDQGLRPAHSTAFSVSWLARSKRPAKT